MRNNSRNDRGREEKQVRPKIGSPNNRGCPFAGGKQRAEGMADDCETVQDEDGACEVYTDR